MLHLINFAIPITMMLFIGFLVDKMCQPDVPSQKVDK